MLRNILECDRCGREIPREDQIAHSQGAEHFIREFKTAHDYHLQKVTIDLCQQCAEVFKRFLANEHGA
jgi:ribosomal protein S26